MHSFAKSMLASSLVLGMSTMPALAGPCSDQIAGLDKQVSQSAAMGPATTGALAGSGPQAGLKPANGGDSSQQPSTEGTSATGKLSGEGGTKEMTAAAGQVATSAQDVRRQQAGLPTMAADPNAKMPTSDEKVSQAKMELETAKALDQKNDESCKDSVTKVQALLR